MTVEKSFVPPLIIFSWLVASSMVSADEYTSTARIIDSDVQAARDEALEDILWQAGVTGNNRVRSRLHQAKTNQVDTIQISNQDAVRSIRVVREEIHSTHIRLTMEIDKDQEWKNCHQAFPFPVYAFTWKTPLVSRANPNRFQTEAIISDLLQKSIKEEAPGFIWSNADQISQPTYTITATLEPLGKKGAFDLSKQKITVRISDPSHQTLYQSENIHPNFGSLIEKETEDMGSLAKLNRWVPTYETEQLIKLISKQIGQKIHCLPTVVRSPNPELGDAIVIHTKQAKEIRELGVIYYASTWPVNQEGSIDMLRIERQLQPVVISPDKLQIRPNKKKKESLQGGFLFISN